jgi:hypothetical protein
MANDGELSVGRPSSLNHRDELALGISVVLDVLPRSLDRLVSSQQLNVTQRVKQTRATENIRVSASLACSRKASR